MIQTFDRDSISWVFSKQVGGPIGFGVIRIGKKPRNLIRNFNTKVTTKPCKYIECFIWLAEASYADRIFIY